jgi:hypothetical protein
VCHLAGLVYSFLLLYSKPLYDIQYNKAAATVCVYRLNNEVVGSYEKLCLTLSN